MTALTPAMLLRRAANGLRRCKTIEGTAYLLALGLDVEAAELEREAKQQADDAMPGCLVCEDSGEMPDHYQACEGCGDVDPIKAMMGDEGGGWFCRECTRNDGASPPPAAVAEGAGDVSSRVAPVSTSAGSIPVSDVAAGVSLKDAMALTASPAAPSPEPGLLPCPFCGEAPRFIDDGSYGVCSVFCPNEFNGCPAPSSYGPAVEAARVIAEWNRRASPPNPRRATATR